MDVFVQGKYHGYSHVFQRVNSMNVVGIVLSIFLKENAWGTYHEWNIQGWHKEKDLEELENLKVCYSVSYSCNPKPYPLTVEIAGGCFSIFQIQIELDKKKNELSETQATQKRSCDLTVFMSIVFSFDTTSFWKSGKCFSTSKTLVAMRQGSCDEIVCITDHDS